MGKKHFSDESAGRRGRTSFNDKNAPDKRGAKPYRSGGAGSDRSGNGRFERDNDRRGEGFSSRPSFGRPQGQGSRPGGNRDFGNRSFGEDRNSDGRSFGSNDRRPSGGREFGGNDRRAGGGRDFGGSDRRTGGSRNDGYGQREQSNNRPVRAYESRETWSGQPYRQEGKPTVPRGAPGERNRKFQKANPNADVPSFRPQPEAPTRPERNEATGTDRPIRAARPFDYRGKPEEGNTGSERPARTFERGNEDRRDNRGSYGDRKTAGGFGKRDFGGQREGRPSYGDRQERNFGGGSRSFSELRASRAYETRERRSGTTTDKKLAPDANAHRAGKLKRGEVAGQAPDYKNLKHYEQDPNRGNKRRRNEEEFGTEVIRLNRYIANAGICSRREADALIAAGEIRVNGEVVTEMGYQVQPSDTVQYGKTNLNREKLVYVLLNKPKDFITTTDDPEGRKTVMDLVAGASKERIFPVGRLDRNTTGLLLFTNDGEVAQKLSHPSNKNKKIYQVELDKPLTEADLRSISEGLDLEDGKAEVDDVAVVAGNAHFVGIELHTGRNRIVRRIFEHLGYEVVTLDRVQYAGLTKKDLPRSKWRFLTEKEVIRLKYFM
ncbi:pseudouridine synthase [Hymenobacter sp. BT507]|uniref:Pseudouridine synthase n=1 Tax=Hymenobacter citatus TaxID=2763506 RepID=A0ABR7MMK0_9BACT|nr:pseudouridine synthase [Hymenobacter citatus]MBC6612308.1 pseudouridine synthase [Hymenobacter citatus]